ncbi:hypothetical protein CRYUN_Cryun02cG0063200 [Craigia yunnanensis]
MLEAGLIEKLVELQKLENQCNGNESGTTNEEGSKSDPKMESDEEGFVENSPFESRIAREACVSEAESATIEAESATIVAEELWGSSP